MQRTESLKKLEECTNNTVRANEVLKRLVEEKTRRITRTNEDTESESEMHFSFINSNRSHRCNLITDD